MILNLDGKGWQLVPSVACGNADCDLPIDARGEYAARQWLRRLKTDSARLAALRHIMAAEFSGAGLNRMTDDQVIDRAVYLLDHGIWHLHPADASISTGVTAKGWKRVEGSPPATIPERWTRPIRTSFGNCLLVRAQDLVAGEEYLERTSSLPPEIAELIHGAGASHALPEIHQALHGIRPAPSNLATLFSMQQTVESAFRDGTLVLMRQKLGAGAGGTRTEEERQAKTAAASGSGTKTKATPTSTAPTTAVKTWFRMQLLDEDGEPMANEDYVVVDSAGTQRKGKLDSNGELYIPPSLPEGECTINFPNIHLNPRKRKS